MNLHGIDISEDRLRELFGREIDLIEKEVLRNPFRRHEILKTHEVVNAA